MSINSLKFRDVLVLVKSVDLNSVAPWDTQNRRPYLELELQKNGQSVNFPFWYSVDPNFQVTKEVLLEALECALDDARIGAMGKEETLSEFGTLEGFSNCKRFYLKMKRLFNLAELDDYIESIRVVVDSE